MTDAHPIPDFLRRPIEAPRERPILFSPEMVRALLAGTKTQTRRALKVQPLDVIPFEGDKAGIHWVGHMQNDPPRGVVFGCKFGRAGDRLWVREAWAQPTTLDPGPTFYRADYPACVPPHFENVPPADKVKWKPSIHMRRADSRITLEVVAIRVERLQDISDEDAVAEGMPIDDAKHDYSLLWDRINGPGSWDANPWVWCISFRRVE